MLDRPERREAQPLVTARFPQRVRARDVPDEGLARRSQASQMWQYLQGTRPTFGALLSLSVDLLVVYALTSLSARDWVEQGLVEGGGAAA
ncbi:hypothetical protein [Dermacoccus nishinomiyaensis]|uniref:hypothetical protein n=1 Tax=Dermacoccus nishinomiyaensis TaxID=1274 RepID=UPI00142EA908|nr:hypothetical protein [Dermacoccus nishinomiyaensis]